LRRHWEYSHAVNAVITFLALCSVTLSVVISQDPDGIQPAGVEVPR
jgi:hypothetical protein